MLENWYSSKKIRQILQVSSQCLYQMRITGRIKTKQISDKKYLYKLPEKFISNTEPKIAIYARVSTPKQKKDLDNHINYLRQYIVSNGNIVDNSLIFSDIASGMNESRKGLNDLITEIISGTVNKVIISNRDRLTRFGYGYLKSLFDRYNCEIIEVNLTEDKSFEQELADDLISIIHHFSMKLYSNRRKKFKEIENILTNTKSEDKSSDNQYR